MKTEKEQKSNLMTTPQSNRRERKPYSRPKLVVHGTLQEITGNVGNGFVDFPQGSRIAG